MFRIRVAALATVVATLLGVAGATAQTAPSTNAQYAEDGATPGTLPVPTVTIYAGDKINEAMIEERPFPDAIRQRMSVVEATWPLIGKVARRTLPAGKPIPTSAVAEPMLVTRGVLTQAVFSAGGIRITAIAFPLRSGAIGDMVQLRNIDSGQIISGIVQADGTVLIGGI